MDSPLVVCKNKSNRCGEARVEVTALSSMPRASRKAWSTALQNLSRRYASPTQIYGCVAVLNLWAAQHARSPTRYPWSPSSAVEAMALLGRLRRLAYQELDTKQLRLPTVTGRWLNFLIAAKEVANSGAFPVVDWMAPGVRGYPVMPTVDARSRAFNGSLSCPQEAPVSYRADQDSYHSALLVPISISASDQKYLEKYESDLGAAINAFERAAELEFRHLQRKADLGQIFCKIRPYSQIESLVQQRREAGCESRLLYIDPRNGRHLFPCDGGNPQVHRHLVAYVKGRQRGIPKSCNSLDRAPSAIAKSLAKYGVKRLAPYLGLLTARSAISLFALLLLDHPRINVESLLYAEVEDDNSASILLSAAGDDGATRLTVDKPRAKSQKHIVLTDRGAEIIKWTLRNTSVIRKRLRDEGRLEEARRLWLGLTSPTGYSVGAFSRGMLREAFHRGKSENEAREGMLSRNKVASHRDRDDFVRSYFALTPWVGRVTLKSLRVSAGVWAWFKAGGDIFAAAEIFGHKDPATTLGNYIPKPLQIALYERQVRRWQNLLIVASKRLGAELKDGTDCDTQAEFQEFLKGIFEDETALPTDPSSLVARIRALITGTGSSAASNRRSVDSENKAILIDDELRLAVAFVYVDELRRSQGSLPKSKGTDAARMWVDVTDALLAPLPDSQRRLSSLARRARVRADTVSNKRPDER